MLDLTSVQDRNISLYHEDVAHEIIDRLHPQRAVTTALWGPMKSGKTAITSHVVHTLIDEGWDVDVFKLGDDSGKQRGGVALSEVWTRSVKFQGNYIQGNPVSGISDVMHFYREQVEKNNLHRSRIGVLVEAPFMGSAESLAEFVDYAKSINVSLLIDGLPTWFNGKPIPAMQSLVSKADFCHAVHGLDLHNNELTELTFRGVLVDSKGEIYVPEDPKEAQDDAYHYIGMQDSMRRDLSNDFWDSHYRHLLTRNNDKHLLLPSHPDDRGLALGALRYDALSMETFTALYKLAGINLGYRPTPSSEFHTTFNCHGEVRLHCLPALFAE
jgi:hypothetical protein